MVDTPPVDWVIYYSNGETFSSGDGDPENAPRRGVICIACRSAEHGRVIWWNGDYYFWRYGSWMRGDVNGLFDYLLEPGKEKIVLFGRFVPNHEFERIYSQAIADPRMAPKSSLSVQEE